MKNPTKSGDFAGTPFKTGRVLGLDIGGSSSRARLVEGGRIVAEAEGPGANVAALPPPVVADRLAALLRGLGAIGADACCAGSAGAEVPARRERLAHLLAGLLPGSRITIVHDTRLVLAAAGLDIGIALISGTGSVAYGRDHDGREARAGGWGWLIGDDGSAAWLAREAAREVMRRSDSGAPLGALGEAMLEATHAAGTTELVGALHALSEPGEWAALAGVVFDTAAKDPAADSLVERAAAGLGELVAVVRRRLALEGPVVLAGGQLLNQPRLEAAVRKQVGAAVRLEEPPVAGAVRLAELSLS